MPWRTHHGESPSLAEKRYIRVWRPIQRWRLAGQHTETDVNFRPDLCDIGRHRDHDVCLTRADYSFRTGRLEDASGFCMGLDSLRKVSHHKTI